MGKLYTPLKVFHFPEKLRSIRPEGDAILPPLHIRIKPTNICGHNCWYCAYKVDNLQLGKDMVTRDVIPREKMLEIIEDLAAMGVKAVTFSGGGEPFAYPHLLDAARELAKTEISFASLTNGARLRGEIAEVFANHATWLRVSIDGWDGESYAEYRGVSVKEFDRVVGNMESFKKLGGGCFLGVSLIVDVKNAPHVLGFLRRMKEIGVDSVKISPCITSNDGAESNRYHAPFFDQVKDQVASARDELVGDGFEINDAYHVLDEKFTKQYTWCPYIQVLPVIGADQNVYSCQDKAYSLGEGGGLIGSIKDQRFAEFWSTDREKFFRIDPSVHCGHHCVANAKNQLILDYLDADQDHLAFV